MDHIVYTDAKSNELEKILDDTKTMIIRGASGRKLPYGRVNEGDVLYFIRNNGEGLVQAKAVVNSVLNSEKIDEDSSIALVSKHKSKLQLNDQQFKRWARKGILGVDRD